MHAPLVHTYRAIDLLPFDHPNWIGGLGLIGGRAGTDAVVDADLLPMGIANGVQLLDRDSQIILHVSEGGFTMLLGEFMTSVEHGLAGKVIVYDNGGWGLTHFEQEGTGNPATKGSTFPNIDFAAFARACGVKGFTAREPGTQGTTMAEFLATQGPAILHAVVNPDDPLRQRQGPRGRCRHN